MAREKYVFPLELSETTAGVGRPCVRFVANNKGYNESAEIILPSPPSISFNDSADYTTLDLGIIGGSIMDMFTGGEGSDTISSISAKQVGDILARTVTPSEEYYQFAAKTLKNPRTNVSFTGNKIRNFGFNFKLIARTAKESVLIKNIHSTFRKHAYAGSGVNESNATLQFPAVWTIHFIDFASSSPLSENEFIPRIYSCYLTQLESSFNSDGNIYFNDSAPLQVDITLQFQETRMLTRDDLESMENEKMGKRGVKDGIPAIHAPQLDKQAPGANETPTPKREGRRGRNSPNAVTYIRQ